MCEGIPRLIDVLKSAFEPEKLERHLSGSDRVMHRRFDRDQSWIATHIEDVDSEEMARRVAAARPE